MNKEVYSYYEYSKSQNNICNYFVTVAMLQMKRLTKITMQTSKLY